MVDEAVRKGCEAFSEGRLEPCLPHLDANVRWEVVGQKTIAGVGSVQAFCAQMTEQGCPNFRNEHITVGAHSVVVEGREVDGDVRYCDVYHIEKGKIVYINSYCIRSGKDI
ncbi:nuclear transport factor 2 family protein [Oceanimonas sp. MB9]|uniref:nuclear transport factor 2 family protein n=1 Tax=Oceanimonas sp. MB9 TaxID=2588453 RepID=UPI0013F59CEE|nr:nuclear transport factor 2 family protein [Oceanimonas sp. MB9]NHI00825.1 hypothetical protein [Oceanimonas sp. MB9]